ALDAARSAAALARELGDADLFARAALRSEDASNIPSVPDPQTIELLREAATGLEGEDSALLAQALSALSRAVSLFGDDPDEARSTRLRAIEMARRIDDAPTLAKVLTDQDPRDSTTPLDEALENLREGRELARELDAALPVIEATWRT